jgi:hypothetical protein
MAERQQDGRREEREEGEQKTAFIMQRWGRFYGVRDPAGELVCVTVYKCGAEEVIRRLSEKGREQGPDVVQ